MTSKVLRSFTTALMCVALAGLVTAADAPAKTSGEHVRKHATKKRGRLAYDARAGKKRKMTRRRQSATTGAPASKPVQAPRAGALPVADEVTTAVPQGGEPVRSAGVHRIDPAASFDWTADATRPWDQEWASYSCASRDRFAQVQGPGGVPAYRFEVQDGDDSYGERCELGQGNPTAAGFPLFHEGDEKWISFQVYIPDDYPVDTPLWNVILQLKQLGAMGPPVIAMEIRNGRFHFENSNNNNQSSYTLDRWNGPAVTGRWVQFTMHVKFSPDPNTGWMELYGDLDGSGQRLLMPRLSTYTMKVDDAGRTVDSQARIGIYRHPAIMGTAHLYFAGYTVADTKAGAEAKAFGA